MYNEAITRNLFRGCAALLLAGMLCSCGSGEKEAAQALYSQAQSLYDSKQYNESIVLLDSLKKNYTGDIDLLKKGLHLRTLNQEGQILAEMAQNDSLISALETEFKKLSGNFKYIKHPDMVEGFYIHNSIAGEIEKTNRVAIEPRIDESDMFYIVSYLTGHDVKHTSIKLANENGASVTSATVPYDEAQNYRYKSGGTSYEIVTFSNSQCDTLGYFTAANEGSAIKVTFQGNKAYSMQLNKKHVKAIAETYRHATNKTQGKAAIQKRMFLQQKLELAKKQIEQTKITE